MKRLIHRTGLVAIAVAVASVVLSAGAVASASKAAVRVKGTEFKFALIPKSAPRGTVVFTFTNAGKVDHDFKIKGKKTALLKPGKTAKLTVSFAKAGRYAFLCTVPSHAAAGMKGTFVVK